MPFLSIIIPAYNEEESLPRLFETLPYIVSKITEDFEVIIIDDGSQDKTSKLLENYASQDPRFRIITFSRNFGQQAAYSAGLAHADGECVILMDADLQDPPELIHLFFEKWKEGNQIVYGIREEREGSKLLSLVYNVFYQLQELFTDISIPKHAGDFCLMDKMVVSILNQDFPEKRKFLRGLRAYVGFKSIGIPFSRPKRTTGSSKYTLKKLFRLASDGVFDFSLVPLRISTITGLLFALIGCIFGIFFMMHRIFDFKVFGSSPLATPGIATVVVGGSFILSLILVILGIIGEYLGRIYYEIKARPQYIIKSRQNFTL